MLSSHFILCRPLLLLPSIPPRIRVFSNESTLRVRWPKFQLYRHSFQINPRIDLLQNGLVGSPCSPRDSQESSPTPQFKSINSSVLSLLHSPTLILCMCIQMSQLLLISPGRNLDRILKSRDISLPTKVCLVKAMVFPVVMYGCESWTVKKAEH